MPRTEQKSILQTPFAIWATDNDLVSEEDQNRLIHLREVFKLAQFEVGDIAMRSIQHASEVGAKVSQARIFEAIGNFCGKSGRTVRYYYENSIFYPPEVREEFDVLPFVIFVLARRYGERWREVLEVAALNPRASEAEIKKRFRKMDKSPTFQPGEDESFDKVSIRLGEAFGELHEVSLTSQVTHDREDTEPHPNISTHRKLGELERGIQFLELLSDIVIDSPLDKEIKNRMLESLDSLARDIPALKKSMCEL